MYELFLDAENYLKDNPEDTGYEIGLKYHKDNYYPEYQNRFYKPGFILGSNNTSLPLIFWGLDFDDTYGFGGNVGVYLGLLKTVDMNLYYLYLEKLNQFYINSPFSLYSDNYKRIGIKFIPALSYISLQLEDPNSISFKQSYVNFSGDLSLGYYINHYWLVLYRI